MSEQLAKYCGGKNKMKKLNMVKYGFVRWPEQDFHDDGNNFQCFRVGENVRVSKLVSHGEAYLSASIDGNLPYEVYNKLPHFTEAEWTYNGVSLEGLTDEDMKNFYNACVEYGKEYKAAEENMVWPTIEELTEQCEKIYVKRDSELSEVQKLLAKHGLEIITKCSEYEWKELKYYTERLIGRVNYFSPSSLPAQMYGKSYSVDFMKPTNNELISPCWYYTQIKEIFEKYAII